MGLWKEGWLFGGILLVSSALARASPVHGEDWRELGHRYCMQWCRKNDRPASGLRRAYESQVDQSQKLSRQQGLVCCKVCTLDCFVTLHDTLPSSAPKGEVTMATYATPDRLDSLMVALSAWNGPAVVVLYHQSKPKSDPSLAGKIRRKLVEQFQKLGQLRVLWYESKGVEATPTNTLRNVAVDNAPSRFLFPLDCDFIASAGLRGALLATATALANRTLATVVVPHWEARQCYLQAHQNTATAKSDLPITNLEEFGSAFRMGGIRPFHSHLDNHSFDLGLAQNFGQCGGRGGDEDSANPGGIRSSNYEKWAVASLLEQADARTKEDPRLLPIKVSRVTQTKRLDDAWEPYVMVARSPALPRYNELFVGRYKNKVSFILALRLLGFRFSTLSRHFLLHRPHPPSKVSPKEKKHGHDMRQRFQAYVRELVEERAKDKRFQAYARELKEKAKDEGEGEAQAQAGAQVAAAPDAPLSESDTILMPLLSVFLLASPAILVALLKSKGPSWLVVGCRRPLSCTIFFLLSAMLAGQMWMLWKDGCRLHPQQILWTEHTVC